MEFVQSSCWKCVREKRAVMIRGYLMNAVASNSQISEDQTCHGSNQVSIWPQTWQSFMLSLLFQAISKNVTWYATRSYYKLGDSPSTRKGYHTYHFLWSNLKSLLLSSFDCNFLPNRDFDSDEVVRIRWWKLLWWKEVKRQTRTSKSQNR